VVVVDADQAGLERQSGPQDCHADLRVLRAAGIPGVAHDELMVRNRIDFSRDGGAPGLVGESVRDGGDMFPNHAVGSVTGIGGMAGAAGGMLIALVAGQILARWHTYVPLFIIASAAYVTAWPSSTCSCPGCSRRNSGD
jgi:hypothetical protein